MKHIWSILCIRSIIDQRTNLISLLDSLEEIVVGVKKEDKKKKKITIKGLTYEVVSYVTRDNPEKAEEGELSINIYNPQKKTGKGYIQKFIMKRGIKRIRLQISVNGINLTTEGKYVFKVGLKGVKDKSFKKVSEIPLDVLFREI